MSKKQNFFNQSGPRSLVIFVAVVVGVFFILTKMQDYTRDDNEISYTQFVQNIEQNKVAQVSVRGQRVAGITTDKKRFEVTVPNTTESLVELMRKHGVSISVVDVAAEQSGTWAFTLFTILGFVLLLVR